MKFLKELADLTKNGDFMALIIGAFGIPLLAGIVLLACSLLLPLEG